MRKGVKQMKHLTKIFYQKFGGTIINMSVFGMGLFTLYTGFDCIKVFNEELYIKNIHKNIGEIISESPINYTNSKTYDRKYTPIESFNGKSWLFNPDNTDVVQGINKLKEKNHNKRIQIVKNDPYMYNNYLVILYAYDKIYIYLDDPDSRDI